MSENQHELLQQLTGHLERIYPEADTDTLAHALIAAMGISSQPQHPEPHHNPWDAGDVLLITYGDSLLRSGEKPLDTLHQFLRQHLRDHISAVHILPFFPYSSDDGFSVIDYRRVNDALGDWEQIRAIGADFRLMADLVINHCSARSGWFENFRRRLDPGQDYFVEADPNQDLSAVVRPRNSPLLTEVETLDGPRHVWTTFSADQVDLNFANPAVLIEFARILRHYLDNGVRLFRLDAVAFLWKQPGTACVHLPQTHELIRLLRLLLDHTVPDAVVITETNVPQHENLTYFGNANEAHVIYNFSLPPLLVHALISGDERHLRDWLLGLPPAQAGTAYLNFIASHDGIGLRPAEDLLDEQELVTFISTMQRFGGRITMRSGPDGLDRPYEINIALFDALKGTASDGPDRWQQARFLCAHTIMLGLAGIPALYIHSLVATENDHTRVEHTGRLRSINRHLWNADELLARLDNPWNHHARIFRGMCHLLDLRRAQPAFHPNAGQYPLLLEPGLFAFWRDAAEHGQRLFAIHNLSCRERTLRLSSLNMPAAPAWHDLIGDVVYTDSQAVIELAPYQCLWLSDRH